MTTENISLETNLWSTKDGADKVYNAYLRGKSGGWVVDYANGKRGSGLATGTRTKEPLSYDAAFKLYNNLVKSKLKDGYTTIEGGEAYTSTDLADRATGLSVQLLTSIDEATCSLYLADDSYGAQLKENGERRPVLVEAGEVKGANRNGLLVNIPQAWVSALTRLGDAILDGEHVGSRFCVFDLLSLGGEDLRALPFASRYKRLVTVMDSLTPHHECLKLVKAEFSTEGKRGLLQHVRNTQMEGIVLQEVNAPYVGGRSKFSFKFKLVDECTCIVISKNIQQSVLIGLLDASGNLKPHGNVTIPEGHEIPAVGDLVDVQFLYSTLKAFEQPVYLGRRTDLNREDAQFDRITRFKPVEVEDFLLV